ncbi:MAG: beta-galactosidase trimerization domain-containing protein [Lachnospiraceae bacterium]
MRRKQIGLEFAGLGSHLINLKKHNRVALLLSNESLTALDWFPIRKNEDGSKFRYNDVVRYIYDALYEINVECDILWPESEELSDYDLLILPAMYTADEKLLLRIADYVEQGGHLLATFKTAFTNENVKVYSDVQPHILNRCFGVSYSHFTYRIICSLPQTIISAGKRRCGAFLSC